VDQQEIVREIVTRLDGRREEFLVEVLQSVRSHIGAQGAGCMTIVGRTPSGGVARSWPLSASVEYAKCLTAFCRGQEFAGHRLDSGLTDPVVEIVTERFDRTLRGRQAIRGGPACPDQSSQPDGMSCR
jgi:hypothetical protein